MTKRRISFAIALFGLAIAAILLMWPGEVPAQMSNSTDGSLREQIRAIENRPEYKHSEFGVEVYSLDDDKVIFSLRGDKLFTPGSTTKLLTEGTGLELLGADYRFHTKVYRTAPVSSDGVLKGDLVLVASGDPNLSGRIQPDGTILFTNKDHGSPGRRQGTGNERSDIADRGERQCDRSHGYGGRIRGRGRWSEYFTSRFVRQ